MKTFLGLIVLAIILVGGYFWLHNSKSKTTTGQQDQTSSQTSDSSTTPPPSDSTSSDNSNSQTPQVSDHPVATIDTSLGSFKVTLDHTAAPKTVENFVKLADEGYYDGLKFHRILKDFVIQGGDPNSKSGDPSTWGQGGPGYTVPAEIKLKANVGAIGMASTQAQGPSSGSQFFVVTTESPDTHTALDGNYTFFGYVTSGMDVVTKIAAVQVEPNLYGEASLPVTPVVINKITIQE
ncbi:MAG TPA: peptidylprolyl isomerase [Patescibacteria group bacterium]|nr:peptidylprolyl isomerase [Patescibacteria group bacterium]